MMVDDSSKDFVAITSTAIEPNTDQIEKLGFFAKASGPLRFGIFILVL